MAIITSFTEVSKGMFMRGQLNTRSAANGGDVYKIALYDATADLNTTTGSYITQGEVVGQGYTAGGASLVTVEPTVSGGIGIGTFENVTWPNSSIASGGCMIYTPSVSNASISVHSFGAEIVSSNGDFLVLFPTFDSVNAVWRFA